MDPHCTVGIWIPDMSGIPMVQSRSVMEWSGLLMAFKNRTFFVWFSNGWPHSKTVRLKRSVCDDSGIRISGFGIPTIYRKYNAHYWFEISFFNFSLPRSSDSTSASVARPTTTTTRAAFVAPSSAHHPSTGPSTTEESSQSCKRLEQQSPLIPITTCNFVPRCLIIKVFTNVC